MVEIVIRVTEVSAPMRITIDLDAGSEPMVSVKASPADDVGKLAAGRALPPLLFATDVPKLTAKIGAEGVARVRALLSAGGQRLADTSAAADPVASVHAQAGSAKGIVLLGGYDVLPAMRFDTLPAPLRAQLGNAVASDPDSFVVWSDQAYAAVSGDGMADVPISRVPDGGDADFMLGALRTGAAGSRGRFGLRNSARPFAEGAYGLITGKEDMLCSGVAASTDILADQVDAAAVYIMCHGAADDGSRFWGEQDATLLTAMEVANVPPSAGAIVFAGCCWGALTVEEAAVHATGAVTPRKVSNSIALSFLRAGVRAFVGCTGTHYSPSVAPYDYFGGPMHLAFWRAIAAGDAPAQALFSAKADYIKNMPHGRAAPAEIAIEYKSLRQFTCLGLGW